MNKFFLMFLVFLVQIMWINYGYAVESGSATSINNKAKVDSDLKHKEIIFEHELQRRELIIESELQRKEIMIERELKKNKLMIESELKSNKLKIESELQQKVIRELKNTPTRADIQNAQAVTTQGLEIQALKNSYISPYNYTQDPIAYNMGTSSIAGPSGTFHVGISQVDSTTINLSSQNVGVINGTVEAWGQTGRLGGFALGGALQVGEILPQTGQPNTFSTVGVFIPSQAYLDYMYGNTLEITVGNVLISTPWVNPVNSFAGSTFSNLNNTFQGITANLQITPKLLLNAFRFFNYLQYPDYGFLPTTLYNSMGGPFGNNFSTTTSGVAGVGTTWNPSSVYNLNVWLYQFYDYADMIYASNNYHLPLSTNVSMDFGAQVFTQSSEGNAITTTTLMPNSNQMLGAVNGNGVGVEWVINVPHNAITLAYNNIFGGGLVNSYLHGGIVTPYTFGLETDPLYTTPADSSLAELGSGSAFLIGEAMSFLDNSMRVNFSFSQYYVNKVYASQPDLVSEYDAKMLYLVPHTNLSFWTRVVYVVQPNYAGGSFIQPRIIINYTF